jgi:hypothetical protein
MSSAPHANTTSRSLPLLLVSLFVIQFITPIASAAGMQSCSDTGGTCDEYNHGDDMTPFRQDWVEGSYVFDMVSTSSIDLQLTWAVREFERDTLGMGSGTLLGNALEQSDNLDANDGAPADLIRHAFNQETAGPGSPTVGQKLQTEVYDAIESVLESGFGTVTSLTTQYTNSFTSGGQTIACSTDDATDALAEGALVDNVFEPPICFSAVASVELLASNFNLVGNAELDLERTYRGLLTMGAEINTSFDLTAQPGHTAEFVINPPSYSTVLAVDASGTLAARVGPPNYNVAEWSMNHLGASESATDLIQSVDLRMGHRNSTQTPTVWIEDGTKALDINLVLDLSDEYAATVDFAAGLYYLDADTLNDWGINMFEVSSMATIPLITSDGIRLAYHNGIVDLTQFTDQFPVADIVSGLGDTVAGVGEITMSDVQWVNVADGTGIFEDQGGLNYSHSAGCTEPVGAGQVLHYCLEGTEAMSASYPIYLQTTSQPFSMNLIDILQAYNTNDMIDDFLDGVQTADLERLMNAGLSLETVLASSYLDTIIPSNLPPSELTVEIILPSWVTTMDGTSSIVLTKTVEGTQASDISFTGTDPYNWEHEIKDEEGNVVCLANQSSCVHTDLSFDLSSINFNEWSASMSFTFALDAELSVYRIGIPTERLPESGDTKITMEAIPSDLVRLVIDLSSRMEDPLTSGEYELCNPQVYSMKICEEPIQLTATRQGMKDFTNLIGIALTDLIHQAGDLAEEDGSVAAMDLSAFEIRTAISGIEAPDGVVSDDEPIKLTVSIPEVTFTVGTGMGWFELAEASQEGGSDIKLSVITSSLQSLFHRPLNMAAETFTNGLKASYVSGSGLTYPPVEQDQIKISTGTVDPVLIEENGLAYTGPIHFTLPRGIQIVDVSSTSGNLIVSEDGGRQVVTYIVPPGEFSDEISYRIQIGWIYFLFQFWVYPTIVLILLMLLIRRRRRKKAKKKAAKANQLNSINKAQLGDHEFADLAGFASPALRHGETIEDMAFIDEFSR